MTFTINRYGNRGMNSYAHLQPSPILCTWQDRLLYIGKLPSDSRLYNNNVCLFALSLGSSIQLHYDNKVIDCNSFFLLPNTRHRALYDQQDSIVWMLIEPTHTDCEGLKRKMQCHSGECFTDISDAELVKGVFQAIYRSRPDASTIYQQSGKALGFSSQAYYACGVKDMRIVKTMEKINSELVRNIPSAELASEVGLSSGRLQQLFKQQANMSLRQYRLWRRLKYACELSAESVNFSEAAKTSGFSDVAHFSRAFHSSFGKTASSILGAANSVSYIH